MRPLFVAVTIASLWAHPVRAQSPPGRDALQAPDRQPLSVLFVGNSLTYVNDLPATVQALAASSPVRGPLIVRSVTRGGASLSEHWRKGEVLKALQRHRPDVLVLQGQSTEPLLFPLDFARHVRLFKAAADAIGARTIIFATWARPAGDEFYRDASSGGSPDGMQARLNAACESLSAELTVQCAPVGRAFSLARQTNPRIRLLDGSQHPTVEGTYLAAAVLFQLFYRRSAAGITYSGGLPEPTAEALRHVAASFAVNPP